MSSAAPISSSLDNVPPSFIPSTTTYSSNESSATALIVPSQSIVSHRSQRTPNFDQNNSKVGQRGNSKVGTNTKNKKRYKNKRNVNSDGSVNLDARPSRCPAVGIQGSGKEGSELGLDETNGSSTNSKSKTVNKRKSNRRKKTKKGSQSQAENDDENQESKNDVKQFSDKQKGVHSIKSINNLTNQPEMDNFKKDNNVETKQSENVQKKKKTNKNNRKKNKNKRYPWKKYIPSGSVDPISLDPLHSLTYPPFALTINKPYIPVEWPQVLEHENSDNGSNANDSKGNRRGRENKSSIEDNQDYTRVQQLKEKEKKWGLLLPTTNESSISEERELISDAIEATATFSNPSSTSNPRHYHLFDGRVLAFYLLSELQFIDPLNRRDLTRDELLHLDNYLSKHKLHPNEGIEKNEKRGRGRNKSNIPVSSLTKRYSVAAAYDEKGVNLSTAGTAGQTQRGRMEIMQQEARALLNSIFSGEYTSRYGNSSNGQSNNGNNTPRDQLELQGSRDLYGDNIFPNEFARLYASHQNATSQNNIGDDNGHYLHYDHIQQNQQQQPHDYSETHDNGIYYHDGGGMLIIDDDVNPGLRSMTSLTINHDSYDTIRNSVIPPGDSQQYNHSARRQIDNFPTLLSTINTSRSSTGAFTDSSGKDHKESSSTIKPTVSRKGISSTLNKIGKMVKKTDPKKVARQKKAYEESIRRAALANQTFEHGLDPSSQYSSHSVATSGFARIDTAEKTPSQSQLERNINLASALGVIPTTLRQSVLATSNTSSIMHNYSGWARPTSRHELLDEFGNELSETQYPETLILQARNDVQFGEIIKLERKWLTFLQDDTAASCPLKRMAKPMRAFVHEYSDYWKLHTESFDEEPRRYIHCVKLRDTATPRPLLSQVLKSWKGPGSYGSITSKRNDDIVDESDATKSGIASNKKISSSCDKTDSDSASISHTQQTAGQSTMSTPREFPQKEDRVPLKLVPRTSANISIVDEATGIVPPPGAMFDIGHSDCKLGQKVEEQHSCPLGISGNKALMMTCEATPRFAPLLEERERPKLTLNPRTKPLELPPYLPHRVKVDSLIKAEAKAEEDLRKKRLEDEKYKNILESAFASEDEDDESHGSESLWQTREAEYDDNDDYED
mmetsp:Transcript_221/g.338  ORF Transcript_221/g.338 Transcript_221/m.338 type:complete len:1129 (+) Transcript_221:51-3437(+)